jgi:lipopolysaccharide core galacturonosyltransferase RgtB
MMQPATEQRKTNTLTLPFFLALGGYFALHIALRVALSGSLDYDEAEQALLGQWLLAGYTEQPPLYTWLQHLFFVLLGKNVFAVSLLKNGILFLTYTCFFFASRIILGDNRQAMLAAFSLLLIPQIGWESQRDMTHTTLVVFATAATIWQTMRLLKIQSLINYCVFGLLLSIGILAKANFFIVIAALLLTLSSFAEGRRILFSKRFLVGLIITVALTAFYVLWMIDNQDIVFSTTYKFKRTFESSWYRAIENPYCKGMLYLVANSILLLTPLWLIYLLIFPAGFSWKRNTQCGFHRQFIKKYLLLLFFILLVVVIAGKVSYVKDRWLQPLLFVVPIFFFARISPATITLARFKTFLSIVAFAAVAIYIAFTIRVVGASYIGSFCRLNYPFTAFAEDLRKLNFTNGLIISDDRFLAGNFHFQFPDGTALIPEYGFEKLVENHRYAQAAIVWHAEQSLGVPVTLQTFIEKTYGIQVGKYPVHYLQHRYLFARNETITLAVLILPLPPHPPK